MIRAFQIRRIIYNRMPKNRWVSIREIYHLVEKFGDLDNEDFYPSAPDNNEPKWKRNVRNVLLADKRNERLSWKVGEEKYRLSG
ncbi:hypothetical protein DSCW_60280 [Desulfosarcina widdelii]|uniref:HTH HARE-type domain-containing protein n=1 Tax=Desulfosarcina widdelii TaxID=947919 RepID=A0A5K7ZFN5_9BACT|nr:hypothetical protein [Desulfosarcina widdelii]BBO78611.1 hypothetical protein DSCW_60280 [Desulfosarcina widdelii]